MNENTLQQSLKEYIALSSQIRLYSTPQIEEIKNANEYRSRLVRNFTEIGALSVIIKRILTEGREENYRRTYSFLSQLTNMDESYI